MRRIILNMLLALCLLLPQTAQAAAVLKGTVNSGGAKIVTPATLSAATGPKTELQAVRWRVSHEEAEGGNRLRVVIDTSAAVKVSHSLNDSQLTIDIPEAALGKMNEVTTLDGDIAEKITARKKGAAGMQLVVELSDAIDSSDYRIFTLNSDAGANKPFRVVIDINKPAPKMNITFTPGLKGKVIALDPGHGGSDTGAIGPDKTQEKNLTLAIALKAKKLLEKAGAKVIMTRVTDVDVYGPNASAVEELQARVNVGNNNKADIFVSIHIDAFSKPEAGGIATYYFQKTGYDAMLARNIQDGLMSGFSVQDRGVKSARFYVIRRTQMPAVLAELGFISNPEEEKMLNVPQNQQQMAQGLVQGLENFFNQAAKKGGGS